jgi:SH3 domain protein
LKTIKYLLATLLVTLSFNSVALTRYVSDDIYIYLHSGPGLEFRITGTLKVGSTVETLKYDKKTKFMQIKTTSGKTGWVKNGELQKEKPAKTLLPSIKAQLLTAQQKLENNAQQSSDLLIAKEDEMDQQAQLIDNLQSEKADLQQAILDLKAKNLELDLLQDTKGERIKMQWLLNGGGVLIFGLLLGLLVPFIPRRKKRKDNW